MRLPTFITFTGVDDQTYVNDLVRLQNLYPIEWGVLISRDRQGNEPRYPKHPHHFTEWGACCAGHLCGAIARDVMDFHFNLPDLVPAMARFQRVQVNTANPNVAAAQRFSQMIGKRVILQTREQQQFPFAYDVDWLFDCSGGAGKRPDRWPPCDWKLVGYAGGISPDNVLATMEAINAVGPHIGPYWLDMESGVRDDNDQFSIEKVWAVCEAVYGRRV